MRRFFHSLRLLLAACILTACTPARTGVIGNTLTTNVKPEISITGQAPLTIQASGRLRPNSGMATISDSADFTFDYAFFMANTAEQRFAYAAIVRIDNEGRWLFQPPARFDGAFAVNDRIIGGFQWSIQLLRVSSDKDWGSAVWSDVNGGAPASGMPEFWLAKRWITHLNSTTRAVMEYREPWPGNLAVLGADTVIVSDSTAAILQQFDARADAAFLVEKKRGEFDTNTPQPQTSKPRVPVNMAKLVGTVIDRGGS
ncbi:exported hypothetical protein [uncultured delta proteobacterium]|uniref:Lipoprotein n=1 Tax=uncultured delta proteobacterium TaxID=34034 RepID=A0A212J687_9DELT|nr:exported hypothetical protein [uncultured delta proteobacterium]